MIEYEIPSTRERRKIRGEIITNRINKVRALERESNEIYEQIRGLGYTKLIPPLRDGWFRVLVLREDISRHKQAHVFQEILDRLGQKYWGREKKYADKAWRKNRQLYRHLYYRPDLPYIRKRVFLKMSRAAQKHFVRLRIKVNTRYRNVYICTLPRYYFVTAYKRAYITHRKIIAPKLTSRIKEIDNQLLAPSYFTLSQFNTYHHRQYHNPNRRRRRQTKAAIQCGDYDRLELIEDFKRD